MLSVIVPALRKFAGRNPVPLSIALAALILVLLAAAFVPVGLPDADAAGVRDTVLRGGSVEAAQAEDLSAFLSSRRWGAVLQEILDEAAAAAAAEARAVEEIEMTRELAEIGFIGLMVEPGEYAVLLMLPDGRISRLAGGDTLPDGRTLVAVTGNSLILATSGGEQEVLSLFPRVRTE